MTQYSFNDAENPTWNDHVENNGERRSHVKRVCDQALLVQEHFQQRVTTFLETYGRNILGIKHHWVRYEFAKGRGQIHAHLLAITDDSSQPCAREGESIEQRCERVEKWVVDKFNMTAMHPSTLPSGYLDMSMVGQPEGTLRTGTSSMSTRTFEKSNFQSDVAQLCNCTQMHKCSCYCMRKEKKKKKKSGQNSSESNRYCRFGCGHEANNGQNDTPGLPLREQSKITRDKRGFLKLELRRNTKRMLQTSLNLLQPWRANCDLQVMLYDSTSSDFDFREIARITDYVVAYSCKGNQTLQAEKDNIKTVIMK